MQASLLLSRAGQTGFTVWGDLDQVFHKAFSASLSMSPGYHVPDPCPLPGEFV